MTIDEYQKYHFQFCLQPIFREHSVLWSATFDETETVEGFAPPKTETPPADAPKKEEKETPEEIRKRARKPPSEGPCKRCGQSKPINRLMLCYPCWLKTQLEKEGWREGQPHPPTCGCDLDCRFDSKGADN